MFNIVPGRTVFGSRLKPCFSFFLFRCRKLNVKVLGFCSFVLCFVTVQGKIPYRGYGFEINNPCCSMPCQQRGVCIPISDDKYTCDCPRGYYGKTCEKTTVFRWFKNKLNLNQIQMQKFVSTGKLIWAVINNIPLLHNAALRYLYLSSSSLVGADTQTWHRDHIYRTLDDFYNHSFMTRGLPPVPEECPTPLGTKGPQTLPNVNKVFNLLFQRKNFKPCRFGTNLMFVTFAQHLAYQFFKTNSPDQYFFEDQEDDFFQMYGSDEVTRMALRSWVNGKLKVKIINEEEYPPYLEEVPDVSMHYPPVKGEKTVFPRWAMGHKMFSVTPMMFAMATIWLREHNRVCDILLQIHPEWSDERVYQTARLVVLGELLTITAGEYFQHFAQYRIKLGYKPHLFQNKAVTPTNQMQHEFGLTYHWHHLMPDELSIQGKQYNLSSLTFSNNRIVFEHGLDAFVDAMSRKPAGEITYRNCGNTFKNLVKKLIKKGRKSRLYSFNDYRRFYNLKPYESFFELVENKEIANNLEELYGDVDAVEFVVGIFMEKHKNSIVPPTMLYLTAPVAFRQILTNPIGSFALWRPSTFGGQIGFEIVKKASLKKLFCLNLKGNCKNNVWVSFRTPSDITAISRTINSVLS